MVRYFVVLPPLSGFCEKEKGGVQRITSTSVRLTTIPKRAKKCKNLLLVLLSIMVAAAAAAATRARLGSGFCTQAVSPTLLWERGWLARLRSVDGQTRDGGGFAFCSKQVSNPAITFTGCLRECLENLIRANTLFKSHYITLIVSNYHLI